jgi:hypothetical protein
VIIMNPPVEVAKRLRPQGIETSLAVGPDSNESSVVEDSEMPGDSGLADREGGDERSDRAFPAAQMLDNAETRRVGKNEEGRFRSRHD